MTVRRTTLFVIVSVVSLVAHVATTWSRRVEVASADRYGRGLRGVFALELSLTAEVMRAQSGLVGHYDGLVSIQQRLKAQLALLHEPPGFLSKPSRIELTQTVEAIERSHRETEEHVEAFKSQHAVLRNSLRFLPVASGALDMYVPTTAAAQDTKEGANSLVRDVLLLQTTHDESLVERARGRLAALASHDADTSTSLPSELALVLEHIRIALDRAPRIAALMRQVVERPEVLLAEGAIGRYERSLSAARATADRDSVISYSLLLMCVLSAALAVILRLRESAEALRRASSELQRVNASLRIEQEKQRELAELKSRFVSMTSHEFRTPLSAVMSSIELLEAYASRWTEEKKREHFDRIRRSVQSMIRMLDGVLMVGRSDAGRLEFNPVLLDLKRFCGDAVETAAAACNGNHVIVLEGLETDSFIVADEALLRHVVENLLSNAIKYSPAGSRVCLRGAREGDDIVIQVSDQGIGIPAQDQARLFETFERGSNVGTISGTGLGLAIAKRAVDLHGGSLSLESEVGTGTRFTVRLPCTKRAA